MDLNEFALTDLKKCRSEEQAKRHSLAVTKFFGIKAGFSTLPYHLWQIWHPCNADALPGWLQLMEVTHLALQTQPVQTRGVALLRNPTIEADLVSQVHALYHQLAAECDDDTTQCLPLIKLCNTVLVAVPTLHADGTTRVRKTVAALSFVRHGDNIHILYFGVAAEFREGGLGTLLMTLAGKCRPQNKVLRKQHLVVCVNTITHPIACLFLKARGFQACQNLHMAGQAAAPGSTLPVAVRLLCQEANVLQPFVMPQNTSDPEVDAAWVWGYIPDFATMTIGAAAHTPFRLMQPENCMLSPPTATEMLDDPACYCCLPGGLLISSIEDCKRNLMLWQHDIFKAQQTGLPAEISYVRGYAPTRVSWHERLALKPTQPLPCSIMQLVLECLTTTTHAEQQYASIVPPSVIQHAMSMLHLMRQYVIALEMNNENTASVPLDTSHVFHDVIDNASFMEHLAVVTQYIIQTPSLFAKPFMVALTQEIDGNWSCMIAINPQKLQSHVQQPQRNADVCGFQYFDPCADNAEFKAASIHPSNPTLFLLTVAKAMLCDDAKKTFRVFQNRSVPFNVTTVFANIQAFYAFYRLIEHTFGDGIDSNETTWFNGNEQFVQIELPEAFPLRCNEDNLSHQSGILCLLFLVDWFVTVSHRTFKWSTQNVKPHVRQEGLWRFPMPQTFKMGTFLKTELSLKLRRNKKATQPPLFLPVDDSILTVGLHSIVVLCDRVMHYNSIDNTTAGVHHVLYAQYLCPPPKHVVNVASPLYRHGTMVDQAAANDWTPQLFKDAAEAATTLMQLGTAAKEGLTTADAAAITSNDSEEGDNRKDRQNDNNNVDDEELKPAAVIPHDDPKEDNDNEGEPVNDAKEHEPEDDNTDDDERITSNDKEKGNDLCASNEDKKTAGNTTTRKNDNQEVQHSSTCKPQTTTCKAANDMIVERDNEDESDLKSASDKDNNDDNLDEIVNASNRNNNEDNINDMHSNDGKRDNNDDSKDANNDVSSDAHTSHENDDVGNISDNSTIVKLIGFGQVPTLTSAKKRPRKRRSTATLSLSPPKSRWKNDGAISGLSVAMINRIRAGMANHSCCSNHACKRPGGSDILSAEAVHERKAQTCHMCKLLAHYICMQWRAKKLCCFLCAEVVKQEAQQQRPCLPVPKPKFAGVDIPAELLSPKDALPWEIQHRNWDMNRIIANEMAHLQYMPWTKMKALVTKQNRKNTIAQRHWTHWSEVKREQHKKERNQVHAMRLEWVKTYRAFEQQFLKTTHSFIPDLRYDKKKKCYVGRAEWNDEVPSSHGETETVTHEREVVLTNEFAEAHFPRSVCAYVKEACRASDGKFFPVPKPVALALDTRVITHVKYTPVAGDARACFVVRYADHDMEPIAEARIIEVFGAKFVDIVRRYAKRGFINVPPGDVKHSDNAGSPPVCTAFHSNIPIQFPQQNNKTCVMSSFASALWAVGLNTISMRVAQAVASSEDNPVVLAELASLMNQQHTWLQPVRIKKANQFNLLTADLRKSLAVVVLKASDGSTTHAITVHDNAMFDSNEATSLMLCQENLDYLCSTATQAARFTGIMAGYVFHEQGKRNRLECSKKIMPGDPWNCANKASL